MNLQEMKGLSPVRAQKLGAAGIRNVEDLARADAAALAKKTGIPAAQLRELRHRAAAHAILADLKAVGPGTLEAWNEQASEAVRELYDASRAWLAAELKSTEKQLIALRSETERLSARVAAQARTPQGRAKLAREGSKLARSTARRAEVAANQARKAAQKTVADVRKRAPQIAKQAQATIRDAERKFQVAARETERTILAEAEKARARTERVVAQARARLG
jgi:hypothetical protein